ncbi:MAG: hypothetical protein GY716_25710 [bacterium]|nr:hypothetical protein [bacterium]
MTTTPAPPVEKKGMQPGLKLLLGCGLGCAGIALILFIIGALLVYWVVTPGAQQPTTLLVGEQTRDVAYFDGSDPDGGLDAMIAGILLEFDHAQREAMARNPDVPTWARKLQSLGNQRNTGSLKMYIPSEVTIVQEQFPDAEPEMVVAGNPRYFARFAGRIFGWIADENEDLELREYRGREYQIIDGESALAFLGGTVIWSEGERSMERAIERFTGGRATPAQQQIRENPDGWLLSMQIQNEGDRILELLDTWREVVTDEEALPDLEPHRELLSRASELQAGLRIVNDDAIEARLSIFTDDPVDARRIADVLTEVFSAWQTEAEAVEMRLQHTVDPGADEARVELRLSGVRGAVARVMTEGMPDDALP